MLLYMYICQNVRLLSRFRTSRSATNLQSLDLSGIYNYLRWLATDPPFRHTEAALREHLHAMIHDDARDME